MKQFTIMCLLAVAVSAATFTRAEEPAVTTGTVDAVTVYRGQALVTRTVEVAGPVGPREVVVTGIPEHVVPSSLYAESSDGLEVRSVRYRVHPVQDDVRAEVREIDGQLKELNDKLLGVQRQVQLAVEKKSFLDKLEQFVAPTANVELSRGVLNAETLKSLTGFLFEQRHAVAEQSLKRTLEERDLRERGELLERQRQALTGSSSRTLREAVVFVRVTGDGGGRLRLRYLVNHATWSPFYNLRTESKRDEVNVEYYASVQQMTGEDWPKVAMTLSTATPNLVAKAPELKPLTIALTSAFQREGDQAGMAHLKKGYGEAINELLQRRSRAQSQRAQQARPPARGKGLMSGRAGPYREAQEGLYYDAELNAVARDMQVLDLVHRGKVRRNRPTSEPAAREAVSVTYQVPSRTTLPSRSDRQLIQIASLSMPGDFYRVATPLLTTHVFEEATVTNASEMVLLSGPLATYVAGEFVGNGTLPTVAVGEKFTVGFGIDPSLRVSRELMSKMDRVQGGNRIVDLTYQLGIENFGTDPVSVRLFDRLPQATESDVKVTFESDDPPFSADPSYLKTKRRKGILRWDVEVPAGAVGTESLRIEYELRLEYDKKMRIAPSLAAAD